MKHFRSISAYAYIFVVALMLGTEQALAVTYINSNFTMLDPNGATFHGTNDIIAEWDGTLNSNVVDTNFNMTMDSAKPQPFFGFLFFYHDIRVFGPGSYSFDTTCSAAQVQVGTADCGGTPEEFLDLLIPEGMIGAHMLADWNVTENFDMALLWDSDGVFTSPNPAGQLYTGAAGPTPALDTVYNLVSVDGDGDGNPGLRMKDGPFIDFSANYNLKTIPLPPALWLFGTGLLGLAGIARRRKAA